MRCRGVNSTRNTQPVPTPAPSLRYYRDEKGGCMVTLHGVYCDYIAAERFATQDIRTEPGVYRTDRPWAGPMIRIA